MQTAYADCAAAPVLPGARCRCLFAACAEAWLAPHRRSRSTRPQRSPRPLSRALGPHSPLAIRYQPSDAARRSLEQPSWVAASPFEGSTRSARCVYLQHSLLRLTTAAECRVNRGQLSARLNPPLPADDGGCQDQNRLRRSMRVDRTLLVSPSCRLQTDSLDFVSTVTLVSLSIILLLTVWEFVDYRRVHWVRPPSHWSTLQPVRALPFRLLIMYLPARTGAFCPGGSDTGRKACREPRHHLPARAVLP